MMWMILRTRILPGLRNKQFVNHFYTKGYCDDLARPPIHMIETGSNPAGARFS